MAFEDLQDSIKESLKSLKTQVIESETGSRLTESYYNLTTSQQRLVILLGLGIFLSILISLPTKPLFSSQEELSFYEERRKLTQKLQNSDQLKNNSKFSLKSFGLFQLKIELESKLRTIGYESDHIKFSEDLVSDFKVAPQAPTKNFSLKLKNSNVRQISKVLRLIENLDDSLLVTQLKTQATPEDPHFFDTEIKITHLSLPQEEITPELSPSGSSNESPKSKEGFSKFKKNPYDFRNRERNL